MNSDFSTSLGSQLKALRKSKGLTQSDFKQLGISAGYISLIEQGLRTPSQKVIEKISKVLGVEADEFANVHPTQLSRKDLASISQVNSAIELGKFEEATVALRSLDTKARTSISGILVECTLDIAQGSYLSATILLEDSFDAVLQNGTFKEKIRALGLYGESSSRLGLRLEAILKLIKIRDSIDKKSDPGTYSYVCLALAARMSEIGEFNSAEKLIKASQINTEGLETTEIGWRRHWAESNYWFDQGQFEKAAESAEKAIALHSLATGANKNPRLQLTKYEALAMQELDQQNAQRALDELRIEKLEFSKANGDQEPLLGDFTILEIQFLEKMHQTIEAEAILEKLIDGDWVSPELNSRAFLLRFEFSLRAQSQFDLGEAFEELMKMLKTASPTQYLARRLNLLAVKALDSGEVEIGRQIIKQTALINQPLYNELAYLLNKV
jgi:transcriptional regulator with XRE-family HTH domain